MKSNNLQLNCVIIEDEQEMRKSIRKVLSNFSEVNITGEAGSIDSAFKLIIKTQPDVAFLDMKLIGGEAFILLDRLKKNGIPIPSLIIITGFPEFAIKALNEYRNNIVHYLLKPVLNDWKEKFQNAIDAVFAEMINTSVNKEPLPLPVSEENPFLNVGQKLKRIDFSEIYWIEASKGIIKLIAENRETTIDMSLASFLEEHSNGPFTRISRNLAVNVKKVNEIRTDEHVLYLYYKNKKTGFSIGPAYYKDFLKRL